MVSALSMLANWSPAVATPTMQSSSSATTRPRLRPTDPPSRPARRDRRRAAAACRPAAPGPESAPSGVAALGSGLSCPGAHAALPSMTMSSTRCSSISSAGPSWTTRPSPTTRTRSASPRTSSISLDTTTTATPSSASRADEGVDLGAGADVDAAGGLVEQQHPAAAQQPAGQDDLLLVAAGQGAHRRGRPRRGARRGLGQLGRPRARSAVAVEEAAAGEAAEAGDGDVAGDRLVEQQGLALALLGGQADPGRDRGADRAGAQPLAVDASPCRRHGVRAPKTVSRISERPEPTRPARPTISPARTAKLTSANSPARVRPSTSSTVAASRRSAPRGGEDVLDRAAGHQPDQLGGRGLLGRQPGGDGAAVLEHGDPVADLADLLEPVGDVDDGDALGGEVADDAEQVLDLLLVEHRRRLVHDDEPGVVGQRAGHADDLLARGRQRADLAVGRISGWPSRASSARRRPGASRRRRRTPKRDCSWPRKMFSATVRPVDQVELLVDRRDAELHGGLRVCRA